MPVLSRRLSRRLSRPMSRLVPGVRRLLARRPWIYWMFVVIVAGLIALLVSNALAEVRRERATWGETTSVQVAIAEIGPGDLIAPLVETRTVPIAMAPPAAVGSVASGATARQQVGIGEIVVGTDIGLGEGPLALMPTDWLAISVDDSSSATFDVGDHAVVLATGSVIAPDAIIIEVLADGVVIGVPADDAPDVAEMVAQRLAVIALRNG